MNKNLYKNKKSNNVNKYKKINKIEGFDALAFTQSTVNLDNSELSALTSTGTVDMIKHGTASLQREMADKLLANTSIKRACCRRNMKNKDIKTVPVDIRLPIVKLEKDFIDEMDRELYSKFPYIDKKINVPLSLCDSIDSAQGEKWDPGTKQCNAFYTLYCRNNLDEFNDKYPDDFDELKWNRFKHECACYTPVDAIKQISANNGHPPKCYHHACKNIANVSSIYLDPVSRIAGPCSSSICAQIINNNISDVGGNVSTSANTSMHCSSERRENEDTLFADKIKNKILDKINNPTYGADDAGSTGVGADDAGSTGVGADDAGSTWAGADDAGSTWAGADDAGSIGTVAGSTGAANKVNPAKTKKYSSVFGNMSKQKKQLIFGFAIGGVLLFCCCSIGIFLFIMMKKKKTSQIRAPQIRAPQIRAPQMQAPQMQAPQMQGPSIE